MERPWFFHAKLQGCNVDAVQTRTLAFKVNVSIDPIGIACFAAVAAGEGYMSKTASVE